eukprot:3657994-Pyramimonas_sp.AAC.1
MAARVCVSRCGRTGQWPGEYPASDSESNERSEAYGRVRVSTRNGCGLALAYGCARVSALALIAASMAA